MDLIAGHVTGKAAEESYNRAENTDIGIVKTFTKEELEAAIGADGYSLAELTESTVSGASIALTNKGNGSYIFTMQGANVTVHAAFEAEHTHSMTFTAAKEPDCVHTGNIAYYQCTKCSLLFEDEKGTKEIADLNDVTIPATGIHIFGDWKEVKPVTPSEKGSRERSCETCGFKDTESIDNIIVDKAVLLAAIKDADNKIV